LKSLKKQQRAEPPHHPAFLPVCVCSTSTCKHASRSAVAGRLARPDEGHRPFYLYILPSGTRHSNQGRSVRLSAHCDFHPLLRSRIASWIPASSFFFFSRGVTLRGKVMLDWTNRRRKFLHIDRWRCGVEAPPPFFFFKIFLIMFIFNSDNQPARQPTTHWATDLIPDARPDFTICLTSAREA
jgi:hypothetical protein